MLDCSVSAVSETLPTTSVPPLSLKLPCGTVPRCLSLFLTFVCMVCVGAHTHAMTHVEVTGQFSGVIFSHHRDLGTELKSLGVAAGGFKPLTSCGHIPKYIQCTLVSGGFGKRNECLEKVSFVGRIKDIIIFHFINIS